MEDGVYILSACRTAIGSFTGQFSNVPAVTLGAAVIEEALKRADIQAGEVSEVIMGHVLTSAAGQNTARQASLAARIPPEIPAYTLNMLCGSGLKAVYNAYNAIKAKESSVVVCGGMENMTLAKHCFAGRMGKKLGDIKVEDTILIDGLVDPILKMHMGNTAEHLARKYEVSRSDQDRFALNSQTKARSAVVDKYFSEEIIGVRDPRGNTIDVDEYVKPETTIEKLSQLKPAFEAEGSVTAGNSSGINDGAAALVVCSHDILKGKNLKALAKIIAFAQCGLDPMEMGLGPIEAIKRVVMKAGWSLDDVDLFEINEAFAVQALLVTKTLNIDVEKVNISGGAIALGHPIGSSGARVLVTLLYNLKRVKKTKGVASLCIGGGMGIAVAIEVV